MADTKGSALTALTGANTAAGDLFLAVDVSDTTQGAGGTLKNITRNEAQNALLALNLYDYVIYLDGSTYKARAASGNVTESGAALHTVIQDVIDSDASRTAPMRVAIAGTGTLTDAVAVPDWTYLTILGGLTSSASLTKVFYNEDDSGGNTNIRFYGPGFISGGITGAGTIRQQPIYMDNVSEFVIDGIELKNSGTHGLSINHSDTFVVRNCTVHGVGDDGISVLNSDNFIVSGNTIYDTRQDFSPSVGSAGIEIEDGASYGVVTGNYIYDCHRGIHCVVDSGANYELNYLTISNNVMKNLGLNGFALTNNDGGAYYCNGCVVTGNIVEGVTATGQCYQFTRLHDCVISNNTAKDSPDDGYSFDTCKRTTVSNISINTCVGRGIDVRASEDMIFSDLSVYNPGTSGTKREAFRATTSTTNLQIRGLNAIDDRGVSSGLSHCVALSACLGHLVVMGVNGSGNNSTGTGDTGISKQSGTGTVIGANSSDIDATNNEVGV